MYHAWLVHVRPLVATSTTVSIILMSFLVLRLYLKTWLADPGFVASARTMELAGDHPRHLQSGTSLSLVCLIPPRLFYHGLCQVVGTGVRPGSRGVPTGRPHRASPPGSRNQQMPHAKIHRGKGMPGARVLLGPSSLTIWPARGYANVVPGVTDPTAQPLVLRSPH